MLSLFGDIQKIYGRLCYPQSFCGHDLACVLCTQFDELKCFSKPHNLSNDWFLIIPLMVIQF